MSSMALAVVGSSSISNTRIDHVPPFAARIHPGHPVN
jgi:hypothetical protein